MASRSSAELLLATNSDDPMSMGASYLLGPALIVAGLSIAWLAIRAWRGDLPRNALAGIRTPATMASDAAWARAHRAGGPWLLASSIGSLLPGALVLFRPPHDTGILLILAGLGLMVALVAVAAFVANLAAQDA